jgi:hypothetical protein
MFLAPYYPLDAGIDDHSSTVQAGYPRGVEFGPLNSHTILGGESDGVCLGMYHVATRLKTTAFVEAVGLTVTVTAVIAVGHTGRCSIVTTTQDTTISRDHRPDISSTTGTLH